MGEGQERELSMKKFLVAVFACACLAPLDALAQNVGLSSRPWFGCLWPDVTTVLPFARPNELIYVKKGVTFQDRLEPNRAIAIAKGGPQCTGAGANGPRPTIRARAGGRVLSTRGHNVFLDGLILENGTAPGTSGLGGNVLVESGSRATLSNVVVRGGNAFDGGGIFVEESAQLILHGSTVRKNLAQNLGGGVAQATGTLVTLNDSDVRSNYATNGGGVAINGHHATLEMDSTRIHSNFASLHGGGIYAVHDSKDPLTNVVFSIDSVDSSISWNAAVQGDGGGVWLTRGVFGGKNNNFDNNRATAGGGGGIWALDSTLDAKRTAFNFNHAADGGALWLDGSASTLTGSIFSNRATGSGGGLFARASSDPWTLAIGSEFLSNHADGSGGGLFASSDGATITIAGAPATAASFEENTANGNGGGAALIGRVAANLNGAFIANSASTGNGGGLYIERAEVTLNNNDGDIRGNHAVNGGAVSVNCGTLDAARVLLVGEFDENSAAGDGGALAVWNDSGSCDVKLTDFRGKGNHADGFGGLVAGWGRVDIETQDFRSTRNSSLIGGGAVSLVGNASGRPSLRMDSLQDPDEVTDNPQTWCKHGFIDGYCAWMIDNESGTGGALYLSNADATITQVGFEENDAPFGGSAIYLEGGAGFGSLAVSNSTFIGNASDPIVGISDVIDVALGAKLEVMNVTFADNGATPIHWMPGSGGEIKNSAIADGSVIVDPTVAPIIADCNATVFDQPEFLGTLNVSGLTHSDFHDPAAGNWEAAVGGLLDGACPSGPAVDIVNQPRSLNTVERGAYEIDWQVP